MLTYVQEHISPQLVAGLAAGLLILAAILFTASLAPAAPTISWTPSEVVQTVFQGQTKTTTVSFASSGSLTNVAVFIVPELSPYVSASPSSFSSISEGATITLTLTLSAATDAPLGTLEGTLQLKDASGKSQKTYAQPLPITLTITDPTASWLTFTNTDVGYTAKYPPGWVVQQEHRVTVFSNVQEPSALSETALQKESSFEIRLLPQANPSLLPISLWFDHFLSGGFAVDPLSRTLLLLDGRDAVRIETSEIGKRVHLYVSKQSDVVEITYGLYAPQFVDEYELILNNIHFTQ